MNADSYDDRQYLQPYARAAARHGAGFDALLWASPQTQAARFEAMGRLYDFAGKRVLDAGCGRADLLEWLASRGAAPAEYVGLEAIPTLAAAAARNGRPQTCRILECDFLREPRRLFVGADAVVFCGSLNTLDDGDFYQSLRRGFDAAGEALLFNFLSSRELAGQPWLRWRRPEVVNAFARSLSRAVEVLEDYMAGDCTVVVRRSAAR